MLVQAAPIQSTLERVYHRAPYPARVVVASTRGLVLWRRRYDGTTDRLVAEALEREQWPAREWERWRRVRLEGVLRTAHNHVPAYSGIQVPEPIDVESLAAFPLLEKSTLRAAPLSFVRDDAPRGLIEEHTSGTTATPLSLYISRADYKAWYALAEARWRGWYGVSRHDRWAIVGGQPVVPPKSTEPPYWVWNAALRQLYLSSYHVSERTAAAYVRAIDEHRVTYLLGYPSSIHALAEACRTNGIRPRPLRVVIANAEPVLDHQRAVISEVFGCPVRETYGMAEYVTAASECASGLLHLWPEAGILEVLAPGTEDPVAPGKLGRFVCTGLINSTMPLIRYLVGDSGTIAPADERCPCGRTLPILRSIEGRSDDLVRTADGRLIGRLDPVFKGSLPISGAQIVQEEPDRFRILVLPADGYGPVAEQTIIDRLRDRVGDVRIEVQLVDQLPLGANGKFKAVVSHVRGDG